MTPDANDLCVFAVKRGNIEKKRFDVYATYSSIMCISNYQYQTNQLGDLVESYSGGTPSKNTDNDNAYWNGNIPWVSPKDFKQFYLWDSQDHITEKAVQDSATRVMPADAVLVVVRSGILKHTLPVAVSRVSVAINQDIRALIPKQKMLPAFLAYYFKVFEKDVLSLCVKHSTTVQSVNANEFFAMDIPVPPLSVQKRLVEMMDYSDTVRNKKLEKAESIVQEAKMHVFHKMEVDFPEYKPSLYSWMKYNEIKGYGLYCNPHTAYLINVFSILRNSRYYVGNLADYVDVNPTVERSELRDSMKVSFVPMTAVSEKTNIVEYEECEYSEVRTGFTAFKKHDLCWAKITPCMQNGKSFLADDMPTEYGFGSTEFHVLRAKDDRVYMPFLWVLLSDSHILEAAQGMFSGTAGQQRVSDSFLKKFPLILPQLSKQKELAGTVMNALLEARKLQHEAEQEWLEAKVQFERELLGE